MKLFDVHHGVNDPIRGLTLDQVLDVMRVKMRAGATNLMVVNHDADVVKDQGNMVDWLSIKVATCKLSELSLSEV